MWESGGIASSFLTFALDGGEWSASHPGRFISRYPLDKRLGGAHTVSGGHLYIVQLLVYLSLCRLSYAFPFEQMYCVTVHLHLLFSAALSLRLSISHQDKYRDSIWSRPRPIPSKYFSIRHLSLSNHSTLYILADLYLTPLRRVCIQSEIIP
jgi:hypothetical protein